MDVARREKLLLTRGDPASACRRLTLRAVAIAAAVVGNSGTMPAAGALIDMTAEGGGATPANGPPHLEGLPTAPLALFVRKKTPSPAHGNGPLRGSPPPPPFLP